MECVHLDGIKLHILSLLVSQLTKSNQSPMPPALELIFTQESIRLTYFPKPNKLRQHWIKIGRCREVKRTEEETLWRSPLVNNIIKFIWNCLRVELMLPKFKYGREKRSTHKCKRSTLDLLKEITKFLSPCLGGPHISDKYDSMPSLLTFLSHPSSHKEIPTCIFLSRESEHLFFFFFLGSL